MRFVIISVFYVFQGYFGYLMINEKSENKMDSSFDLRIAENHGRT